MYLIVEENPNCASDERVFPTFGEARLVSQVRTDLPSGETGWCDVVGVDENGAFAPAHGQQVQDSSDGAAWLVFGGTWGLRLRESTEKSDWSLDDKKQWGVPFLVLDQSGKGIRFKES